MAYLGMDIGGTKCALVRADSPTAPVKKIKFPTERTPQATLERLFREAEQLRPFDAVGISCGGPLDEKAGLILSPPNLPGWDRIPIVELVQARLHVPAFLCNDANACALAEWQHGAGRGTRSMAFLTFGTGLGAGLILDGRLYRGARGMAGEVGHVRMTPHGPVGYGKAGSFEGYCSGAGIAALARTYAARAIARGEAVAFTDGSAASLAAVTAKDVADAARSGDATARRVFRKSAEKLGEGLAILVDVLAPEAIVIGSIYARCEDLLADGARRALRREAIGISADAVRILPAALGESIGDVAALTVAEMGFKGNV